MMTTTTRQVHTVLGGGIRYEPAELMLSIIPNFQLKQKGRILHLFTEIYNVFMQEIQEALDERQNHFDSLLANNQTNTPFAFESQIDHDINPMNLSLKSTDDLSQEQPPPENNISNETFPLLAAPHEKENHHQRRKSKNDSTEIKREALTPPQSKRHKSKTSSKSNRKIFSSIPSMRQMTMTQLFDPIETPKSTTIKQEPNTPSNDTLMFMPESLIGLAQPSERLSGAESEQNNLSDLISQSLKRKFIPSPISNDEQRITTDEEEEEEEDVQNEALLQSPSSTVDNEELLYACPMCRNYWLGLPEELRRKEGLTCRHRQRPVAHTPEHFWSLGIPSTQTCIQRGYGGVLPPDKPIQRPRRPRRQYQRRLQERKEEQNDPIDDDNEN